jgi:hypothetical protein
MMMMMVLRFIQTDQPMLQSFHNQQTPTLSIASLSLTFLTASLFLSILLLIASHPSTLLGIVHTSTTKCDLNIGSILHQQR